MLDGVQGFISKVLRNERLSSFSEDQTKLAIILPLLHELGWNIFNDEEVVPEYSLGRKRVDYALRTGNSSKVFIEAKKCSVDLDDSRWQEQLLNYAFQEGVKLAILTNGISWWFYLPLREGNWEQRKFDSIDLNQPSPENVANRFVEFLSKDNVISGKSVESAERVISSRQKARVVKDTLPKAWDILISEPDELLVELLKDKVENLCGFSPTPSELKAFLKENRKKEDDEPRARSKGQVRDGKKKKTRESPERGEIIETARVSISTGRYRIERYKSHTILVFDLDAQEYVKEAKPVLRAINVEKDLKIDLNYSSGNKKNTRFLGKDIIPKQL